MSKGKMTNDADRSSSGSDSAKYRRVGRNNSVLKVRGVSSVFSQGDGWRKREVRPQKTRGINGGKRKGFGG